ncbi:hypothetical protein [Desulfonatronum sp. SC1]|uniref:hypothetical protein n=1 Tax=Desulfonatronum sp. SC1 TaxID=2109626 RepID=UPI000D31D8A2|nr:hypothetical protein [Desulfonatronum sp. SC1]PTN37911.1 hypothetical protein C6366_05135 [Desulfonatronum sp. SC1]
MVRILTAAVLTLVVCLPMQAQADEVLEAIEQAVTLYKQGDYTGAAGNLDYASQLVRQQKGGQLESFLPEALSGWTAADTQSSSMGAMFMGGVSAERSYRKDDGDGRVKVAIFTDSPMLQPMMMMFSNPMIVASSGAKLETHAGQRAIVDYVPGENRGEIRVVVDNSILVTVEGQHVEKVDLVAYLEAIDFQAFSNLQ